MSGTASGNPYGYTFNHTMLRVKDPEKSLEFYCEVLGMTLIRKLDIEPMEFSLYFLGFVNNNAPPPSDDDQKLTHYTFSREACLELTHNWGTEDDPEQAYHDGNSNPRGFGHIGIAVPDLQAAVARFDEAGVKFVKRPEDGAMKHIAFIKDPDGYWVEIFNPKDVAGLSA